MIEVNYVYARNGRLKADGTGSIQLRIYDPRTQRDRYSKTGQSCLPDHWDKRAYMVLDKPDRSRYMYLLKILTKPKDYIRDAAPPFSK